MEQKVRMHNFREGGEILHQALVRIPFFISDLPTLNIAIPLINPQQIDTQIKTIKKFQNYQVKTYYVGLQPIYTMILSFENLEDSISCFNDRNQQLTIQSPDIRLINCKTNDNLVKKVYYCKDVSSMSGILFKPQSIYVSYPQSLELRQIINLVSKMIVVDGVSLEEQLKYLKIPVLSFLDNKSFSSENIYYRWRVYSYLQGDGDRRFRTDQYKMFINGSIWHPPTQHQPIKLLNIIERQYFTTLITTLTNRKYHIEEAMVFAIYNCTSAIQILSIMVVYIFQNTLPIFYLISDILFNSTTTQYRDLLLVVLPSIIYKLRKSPLVDTIKHLLQLWKSKFIMEQDYLAGLIFSLTTPNLQNFQQSIKAEYHLLNQQTTQTENIQSECYYYGIPYFDGNQKLSEKFLNLFKIRYNKIIQKEPSIGAYDGEEITERDISKIKSKSIKIVVCQKTQISSLFDKRHFD